MSDGKSGRSSRPTRTFLFLQGLASPFFRRLGRTLKRQGYGVERINLNLGDRLFWNLPGAADYRGSFQNWRRFLAAFIEERGVTDLVLFGDGRPYHRIAIGVAQLRGVKAHVFEEGYFRPDWITVEANGVNGYSTLPRDPGVVRDLARGLPEPPKPQPIFGDMGARTVWDVTYNFAHVLFPYLYPGYRRYRPHHPVVEYASWIRRLARRKTETAAANAVVAALKADGAPFFLLPLQLDSDYQIRLHSRFTLMTEVVDLVAESFAAHAPADARLVVKLHPLDNGLVNRRKITQGTAERLGLGDRLIFIDGGDGRELIAASSGVVVVNSTIGTEALIQGKPLMALGQAIYAMEGLSHQGDLDAFWTEPTQPDMSLVDAFRRVVFARTLLNGGFYAEQAIEIGVANAAERLIETAPSRAAPFAAGWRPADAYGEAGAALPGE